MISVLNLSVVGLVNENLEDFKIVKPKICKRKFWKLDLHLTKDNLYHTGVLHCGKQLCALLIFEIISEFSKKGVMVKSLSSGNKKCTMSFTLI